MGKEEKEEKSSGGTNWLFVPEKLFGPSLDLLGNEFRNGLKKYLDRNSREKKQLEKAKRKFLERQVLVLKFSHVQLEHMVVYMEQHILETELPRAAAILRETIQHNQLADYESVFKAFIAGIQRDSAPSSPPLRIIYEVSSGIIDWLALIQSLKLIALVIQVPPAIHEANPDVTNAELDDLFRSEETMLDVQELVSDSAIDLPGWMEITLREAYGVEPE